jgi:hypothetical protein
MIRRLAFGALGVAVSAAVFVGVSMYVGYLADRIILQLSAQIDAALPF